MGETGFEPARIFQHEILSLGWLPLHHSPIWLRRLDLNQRSPAYEAGDLDLLSTPQYFRTVLSLVPGLLLNGRSVLQVGISTYNHRQNPPLDYFIIALATYQPRGSPLGLDHSPKPLTVDFVKLCGLRISLNLFNNFYLLYLITIMNGMRYTSLPSLYL